MYIIPAIDLKNGKCVRLRQGKFDEMTVYFDNPADAAKKWQDEGAEILHVVDLDGAKDGKPVNLSAIEKIREAFNGSIEVGGGIRNFETLKTLLNIGIDRAILGTIAVENPEFVRKSAEQFPNKIIVGIDAKDGYVAVKGWVEITKIKATELALKLQDYGIWGVIYTDISRDGMLTGPNIKTTEEMVQSLSIPVIASGGVSSLEDILNLKMIKGLWGAITGKAIYEGRINLREAIKTAKMGTH